LIEPSKEKNTNPQTQPTNHSPLTSPLKLQIHPGLIGTAPSAELLAMWNERERALVAAGPEVRAPGRRRLRGG